MDPDNPLRNPAFILRAGLVVLLLVLLFGPYWLRATVPIWIPFLILAGLELNFFVGAVRAEPPGPPNRGPQPVDQELYGYAVEDEDELWSDGEPNEIEPEPVPYRAPSVAPAARGRGRAGRARVRFLDHRQPHRLGRPGREHADRADRPARRRGVRDRRQAGHGGVRRGGRARRRRPARGRRGPGRRRRRVPDAGALLRPLPAGVQGRGELQPDGPLGRRSRARGAGTCAASRTRARPSASRSSRASSSASGSDSRRSGRAR